MPAQVMRNAVQAIALLGAIVFSRPVFAEGGSLAVTAESSVVLWGSETEASGAHLSAVTFELPVGTKCHVAEDHAFAPRWICALGGATVSGYARRAAFTKKGLRRLDPKSAFWKRLQRYSAEWAKCTRPNAPSEDCGRMLALRLNLFWAARVTEVPRVDLETHSAGRTFQCPPDPSTPACVGNVCEAGCFSRHLGEGRLIGDVEGAVFLQQAGEDTLRLFAATADRQGGLESRWVAPPMPLFDPMLVSLLRGVQRPESLAITVNLGRDPGTFLETQAPSERFRTPLRLDGHGLFVVCDAEIVRGPQGWPDRIDFEEIVLPDLIVPIYAYLLPCASSLVIGGKVSGISVGTKAANPFGTPPRVTPGPDGKSLSVGPLTLRGEPASEAGRLKRCTLELQSIPPDRYRSCRAVYAGDLNGDEREEFVIDLRGESGCGGATLFLSTPAGWKKAAQNSDYC